MNGFYYFLKDKLDNCDQMDAAQMELLVAETNRYFASLKSILDSGEPIAIAEATQEAIEIKKLLEANRDAMFSTSRFEPSFEGQEIYI